ncbi:MAG TPA: lysylphosphatidylglycerol synthase domain-containing protein, partial [Candidatus Saccharimonadales bacterium]
MAGDSYLKRNWKLILNVVTIAALVVLVVLVHKQLGQTFDNLVRVHAWALLLLIPVEAANYHAQTRMYQSLLEIIGDKLSYKHLFKLSLELNFVNHVFPSGGVSGISYFSLRLRSDGVKGSHATLAQLMKLVLTFISFELLLIVGMLILASVGKANGFMILIGGCITTLIIVGTALAAFIIGSRQRVQNFFSGATRVVNWLIHLVRPHHPETISLERARPVVDELHDNYNLFKNNLDA